MRRYYFTQFVGDANARPTIRGSANFTGIALIDCDPYIPGGDGANWYINQNQFFRQIRNFIFDMTAMPFWAQDGDQFYAPTGIHWYVTPVRPNVPGPRPPEPSWQSHNAH